MSAPMKIRAVLAGDTTEDRALLAHEMETGLRQDADGRTIPAWFIETVAVTHNGRTVLAAQWGPAVAKNPLLAFRFKGGARGDKVQVTWVDTRGDRRADEATIG